MNQRINELAEQAGLQLGKVLENYTTPVKTITVEQKKFADLIVQECIEVLRLVPYNSDRDFGDEAIYQEAIGKHFGIEDCYSDLVSDGGMDPRERELIGYTEREEGFYPLYAPSKSSIVTQAFITCKYCQSAIYHCMGPKYDAVCLPCYERDPYEPTNF